MFVKKAMLGLMAFGIFLAMAGCGGQIYEETMPSEPIMVTNPKEPHEIDPAGFVEFNRSTVPLEHYVPVAELMEYETQYPDCNGTWYRDQLQGEELLIYNSYFYALENRFIGFSVYVENSSENFSHIREMVSLDSPFLEQNYTHYEQIWKRPTNYAGQRIYISMEQFTDSRWDMKMEALEKCRQVVADIPAECDTQLEKMEYLYDYVCDNVEYTYYEKMADESFFYDAVCNGKSLCDGYSNMLSLLFRLIGVECSEVMGKGAEGQSGHTWVAAKVDGEFYNFDATYEDTGGAATQRRIYFGFSDALLDDYELAHEEMRAKCTDTSRDYAYTDILVSSLTDPEAVEQIVALMESRLDMGENATMIGVQEVVAADQYDRFFALIGDYATRSYTIALASWDMQNSTVLQITLTP